MIDTYGADAVAIDLAYGELDLTGLAPECVEIFHRRRIAMDAYRILFPSNYFDLVVSHSLFRWFFLFRPKEGEDIRMRVQRGLNILNQMVRVTKDGGEVRTTGVPDPNSEWFAKFFPDIVNDYRAAFREFLRPYTNWPQPKIEVVFNYKNGQGYTVIKKLDRFPRVDARSNVSVIRDNRRRASPHLRR
jgi:ubiquinone/menaquinone biosynthesis C-methylase UbiE